MTGANNGELGERGTDPGFPDTESTDLLANISYAAQEMKHEAFVALAQFRPFWRIRRQLGLVVFWFRRQLFQLRTGYSHASDNLGTFRSLLKLVQAPLISAIGAGILLPVTDYLLGAFYRLQAVPAPAPAGYVTLLASVGGVGGLFIGLYYTAMSTVSGAIYSRVPNNIRELLSHERGGTVYMQYLAFLTFLSLILIAEVVSGVPPLRIAAPVVLLLSGVAIIAFVKLGQRAFNFFDPSALVSQLIHELWEEVEHVEAGGFQWNDPSFQEVARRKASALLDTLDTMASVVEAEPHLKGQPFASLAGSTARLVVPYLHAKKRIPPDSRWFKPTLEHKRWFRSDEVAVGMARLAGTVLSPETVPDRFWIEDRISRVILRCVAASLDSDRYEFAFLCIKHYEDLLCASRETGRGVHRLEVSGSLDRRGPGPVPASRNESKGNQRLCREADSRRATGLTADLSPVGVCRDDARPTQGNNS
jgi:hypothetical protein